MSVPNQKKVKIATRTPRDKDNLYAMMNLEALQAAMQDLKGSALKVWLYFNKNQDHYEFELSQKACSDWGIKKDSYYAGVEELIDKGYLIPIYYGSNIFVFYEVAQLEKAKEQKATWFSEMEIHRSENQIFESQNPERNNTNITEIIQNKTMESSYSPKTTHHNAFAVGKSGGGGKATTASSEYETPWADMSAQERNEYCKKLGF